MACAMSHARGRCIASAMAPSFSRVSDFRRTETVLLAIKYSPVFSCSAFYPEMQWRATTKQRGVPEVERHGSNVTWILSKRTHHVQSRHIIPLGRSEAKVVKQRVGDSPVQRESVTKRAQLPSTSCRGEL